MEGQALLSSARTPCRGTWGREAIRHCQEQGPLMEVCPECSPSETVELLRYLEHFGGRCSSD